MTALRLVEREFVEEEAARAPHGLPPIQEKRSFVQRLFTNIAPRYDWFNRLASCGIDQRWRRQAVRRGGIEPGQQVLDVCAGTGDLAMLCATRQQGAGQVVGIDMNPEMLAVGRRKQRARRLAIAWCQGDAERLPFASGSFDRVLIGFSTRNLSDLKEGLQEAYQIPVYTLTPLQAFSYDKDFDLTSLRESGELSLLASLGFLLAGSSLKMNLIPAEILKKKRSSVRRRILVRFWGMLLIAVVLGSCAGGIHIYHDSITLSRLTKKMEEPRTRVHQAEQTIQSWRFIKDRMGHRIFMAEIMEQLYHLTPGEISFHSLYIDGEGGLTIQGIADTAGLVNDFQNRLVNSESFKDVQLEYATQRKRFHQEYIDFKITGHLKTEGRVDDEG